MGNQPVIRRIKFTTPPAIGSVLMHEAQRYELIELRPHVRADGNPTSLLVWRSHCAECGEAFEIVTGLVSASGVNRRCKAHHRPGRAVTTAGKKRQVRFLSRLARRDQHHA